MAEFEENPAFWGQLDSAVMRALDEVSQRIRTQAQAQAFPPSTRLVVDPAKRDAEGPFTIVRYPGRGLGKIFEVGATNRTLRGRGKYPAGTYRGSIRATRALQQAVDAAVLRGLPLDRYL